MEEKFYYVSINGGRQVIPIFCTEKEVKEVGTAIGKGLLADSCTISLTERDAWDGYKEPYMVLWDCM